MIGFLRDMFGDAITPERRLTVFTTPDLRTMRFAGLDGVEGHALDASRHGREVYFGLGLIRGSPQGRGTADDVAAIGALWADIDLAGPAHPGKALPASLEEVEALLGELPLAPSVVVDSGHGAHAYWLLKEPWVFENEADRQRAAGLARAWHGLVCRLAETKGWKLENLGGLARVLRLPGTVNHKLPEQPAEVRILRSDPSLRYNPSDFEEFVSAGDETPPDVVVVAGSDLVLRADASPPAQRMVEAVTSSPKFLDTWNRRRPDLLDQSQSSLDLSLATIAAALGWADQEMADLIIAARREHNEKPEKALRRDYMLGTLTKARQAVAEMPTESADVDLSAILDQPSAPPSPPDPGGFPAELIERCPDLVRQVLDYHRAWSVEVQPALMLASLVAATGCVLGHKVQDRTGLRTNVYVVGITGTGGGKEPTREAVRRIFAQAGLESMCGPEDFASDTGLIAAVEEQNPILFQIDEFGRLMQCVNAGPARNPHLYNIGGVLLKFYSKAASVFRSKAYADTTRNRVIVNPHVCLYGTTVKDNFWRAMDLDSLEGGFLPRVLLFESREDSREGGAREHDPPESVAGFFADWAARRVSDGNLASAYPRPMIVPYSDAAWAAMADFRAEQKEHQRAGGVAGALWSRARENAGKLALIHACWKAPATPAVDTDSAQWAVDLTRHSVQLAIFQAHHCLAETPFHQRCQRIMQVVRSAPDRRLAKRDITRATRGMTPRERDEALESLVEEGSLRDLPVPTRGRKRLEFQAV